MTRDISKENLIPIIKNAFKPYKCHAQIYDGIQVSFRVFDNNGESIFTTSPLLKEMQSSLTLSNRLMRIREVMKHEGYNLDHWEYYSLGGPPRKSCPSAP